MSQTSRIGVVPQAILDALRARGVVITGTITPFPRCPTRALGDARVLRVAKFDVVSAFGRAQIDEIIDGIVHVGGQARVQRFVDGCLTVRGRARIDLVAGSGVYAHGGRHRIGEIAAGGQVSVIEGHVSVGVLRGRMTLCEHTTAHVRLACAGAVVEVAPSCVLVISRLDAGARLRYTGPADHVFHDATTGQWRVRPQWSAHVHIEAASDSGDTP